MSIEGLNFSSFVRMNFTDFVGCENVKEQLEVAQKTARTDSNILCLGDLNKVVSLCLSKCGLYVSTQAKIKCILDVEMPSYCKVPVKNAYTNFLDELYSESSIPKTVSGDTCGLNHVVGLVSLVALVGIAGVSIAALSRCVWNKPVTKI